MIGVRVNKDCKVITLCFNDSHEGYLQMTQWCVGATEITLAELTQKDIDGIIGGLQELRQYVKEG